MKISQATLATIGTFFSVASILAEPPDANTASPARSDVAAPPSQRRMDASVSASYTAGSRANFNGLKRGNSDAANLSLGVRGTVPINTTWTGSWGIRSENLLLDTIPSIPIPDQINTLGLSGGAGCRLNEAWTFNATMGATLYRFENIQSDTFGFSGGLMSAYRQSDSLRWNFGVMISPDSDLKALPAIGVRWAIDDRFTLDAGIPRTRLSCQLNPAWTLYTGLDMVGTTFRVANNFGATMSNPRYNNALATYRDIRYGVGAGVRLYKWLNLEAEAGASLYRRIDYTRLDQEVRFRPAPYIRLGLAGSF